MIAHLSLQCGAGFFPLPALGSRCPAPNPGQNRALSDLGPYQRRKVRGSRKQEGPVLFLAASSSAVPSEA